MSLLEKYGKDSETYIDYANDFHEVRKNCWLSIWYQAREIVLLPDVKEVLEFGTGRGLTKTLIEHFGIKHTGVDVNPIWPNIDVVSTIEDFPIENTYDLVCSFQVLEHNRVETFPVHLEKFAKLSRKYIYISLPYSGRWIGGQLAFNFWRWAFFKVWVRTFSRLRPKVRPVADYEKRVDWYNPHWWEVGDAVMPKSKVNSIFKDLGLSVVRSFHSETHPYHLFYLLEKNA